MASRMLALYDGSPSTREVLERALKIALETRASLFVLGMRPEHETSSVVAVADALTHDLSAFVQRGSQLGADVDASFLDAPTSDLIQQVLLAHSIDRVVVSNFDVGASSATMLLWKALRDQCPVPITVIG